MHHQPLHPARQPLLLHPLHGFAEHGPLPAGQAPNAEPLAAEPASGARGDRAQLAGGQRPGGAHDSADGPGPAEGQLETVQGLLQPEGRHQQLCLQPGAHPDRVRLPAPGAVRFHLPDSAPAPCPGKSPAGAGRLLQEACQGGGFGRSHVPGPLHPVPRDEEHQNRLHAGLDRSGAVHAQVHQGPVHPDPTFGLSAQRHQPRLLLPDRRQVDRSAVYQDQEGGPKSKL